VGDEEYKNRQVGLSLKIQLHILLSQICLAEPVMLPEETESSVF
jgi:hypothetical protein